MLPLTVLSTKFNLAKLTLLVLASFLTLSLASADGHRSWGRSLMARRWKKPTIASVASTVPELSILLEAVAKCKPLLDAVQHPKTTVTLFAPTNTAFANALTALGISKEDLLADTQTLCNILDYHIVPAASKSDLSTAMFQWHANVTLADVMVNQAKVVTADIKIGSNSIVHIIDAVLLPPEVPTIYSTVMASPDLSILAQAVDAVPAIKAALSDPWLEVTVVAPTNKAFLALLTALDLTAEELLGNTELLTTVLLYHVSPVIFRSTDASTKPLHVDTLQDNKGFDGTFTVILDGSKVKVNDATVIVADIEVGPTSIVHTIDAVLVPEAVPTIAEVVSGVPTLSILLEAVKNSPAILKAATDPTTHVTVLAPTNEACAAKLAELGISAAELLADENLLTKILSYHIIPLAFAAKLAELGISTAELLADKKLLTKILSYHIIPGIVTAEDITSGQTGKKWLNTLLRGAKVEARVKGDNVVFDGVATVVSADVKLGNSIAHVIDTVLDPSTNKKKNGKGMTVSMAMPWGYSMQFCGWPGSIDFMMLAVIRIVIEILGRQFWYSKLG
eukprot:gene6575-3227_t